LCFIICSFSFLLTSPAPTDIYTLSLHDALPIWLVRFTRRDALSSESAAERSRGLSHRRLPGDFGVCRHRYGARSRTRGRARGIRSEEHTSELQSPCNLVCRLLLEKKKKKN